MNTVPPCRDFFDLVDLEDDLQLDDVLETLIRDLDAGYFHEWALVERAERGAALSARQQQRLTAWRAQQKSARIDYINGLPRPCQPWYRIAARLLPRLLRNPFPAAEIYEYWGAFEGWPTLREVLLRAGSGLPLPPGAEEPLAAFPADLRYGLDLQACCSELAGAGRRYSLSDAAEAERIAWLLACLRRQPDLVAHFQLDRDKLLAYVQLPAAEAELFKALLRTHGFN